MSDAEILKENGWEIECESPFEIRHTDGSFATMSAAYSVLNELKYEASHTKFEYKEEYLSIANLRKDKISEYLNDMGDFGWELVYKEEVRCKISGKLDGRDFMFKREKLQQ